MADSRHQTIEKLKEAGFWNEEAVAKLDEEYVEIMLDIYRFTKAEADACSRLKEYELKKALADCLDNPRTFCNVQTVDADLGKFTRKICNHDK